MRFTEPILLDLNALLGESTVYTPIICFLTMGSDPTRNIELTAKGHDAVDEAISMGQGQEVHARKLMDRVITNVPHFSLLSLFFKTSLLLIGPTSSPYIIFTPISSP
jgi:hypothetical protein